MAKPKKPAPRSVPKSLDPTPEMPIGSQADYEAFLPLARDLAASEVVPMRANLALALQNVQVGVSAVMAEQARLEKLPETRSSELAELPRLVLATLFADTQIERTAPASELQSLLARGSALRSLLLKTAESLAAAGLLPAAAVAKIHAGKGKLDSARDCVELAALFGKNAAALRGKSPVTAAQIKEAAEVGTQLLTLLKPSRARRTKPGASAATSDRDRLWTLVLARHDALWRAGAYLFGRDVDEKVPLLQARRLLKPKKAPPAPALSVAKAS